MSIDDCFGLLVSHHLQVSIPKFRGHYRAFAEWPAYPTGGGGFLKKLGASFSRNPPPPRGRGRSLVGPPPPPLWNFGCQVTLKYPCILPRFRLARADKGHAKKPKEKGKEVVGQKRKRGDANACISIHCDSEQSSGNEAILLSSSYDK